MKKAISFLVFALSASVVFAGDVVIKDVPEGAEENVRSMAAVAVERYLRQSVKVAEEVEVKFQEDVDTFRKANLLDAKFEKPKEPVEPVIPADANPDALPDLVNQQDVTVIKGE